MQHLRGRIAKSDVPPRTYVPRTYVRTYASSTVSRHFGAETKNIKNVAGCRDTRTAKSKETRGMIEHNSEVYNHPYLYYSDDVVERCRPQFI